MHTIIVSACVKIARGQISETIIEQVLAGLIFLLNTSEYCYTTTTNVKKLETLVTINLLFLVVNQVLLYLELGNGVECNHLVTAAFYKAVFDPLQVSPVYLKSSI